MRRVLIIEGFTFIIEERKNHTLLFLENGEIDEFINNSSVDKKIGKEIGYFLNYYNPKRYKLCRQEDYKKQEQSLEARKKRRLNLMKDLLSIWGEYRT